jgi:hypothetical protein
MLPQAESASNAGRRVSPAIDTSYAVARFKLVGASADRSGTYHHIVFRFTRTQSAKNEKRSEEKAPRFLSLSKACSACGSMVLIIC